VYFVFLNQGAKLLPLVNTLGEMLKLLYIFTSALNGMPYCQHAIIGVSQWASRWVELCELGLPPNIYIGFVLKWSMVYHAQEGTEERERRVIYGDLHLLMYCAFCLLVYFTSNIMCFKK
jgi:hypothetical protein